MTAILISILSVLAILLWVRNAKRLKEDNDRIFGSYIKLLDATQRRCPDCGRFTGKIGVHKCVRRKVK